MTGLKTPARTIAITSGKGGVGKSAVTANLSCALARRGARVLLLDADLGLANMDILMNLHPVGTLQDVLDGDRTLDDVTITGPAGVVVLPSGSGLAEYARLTGDARVKLPEALGAVVNDFDYILLDTGAGISDEVIYTVSLAQEVIVVATPEPTSFADAYATIKVLALQQNRSQFSLAINMVRKEGQGKTVAAKLQQTADRFLQQQFGRRIALDYLGEIPADVAVEVSVRARTPVLLHDSTSPAARALDQISGIVARQKPAAAGLRAPTGPDDADAGIRNETVTLPQASAA